MARPDSVPAVVELGVQPDAERTPLRLTVTRGALGIELYEPVQLGPLSVTKLSTSLHNLRFPIDLSGGVRVFRHHRGELERLELTASMSRLSKWLGPRLRGALGGLVAPVSLWPVEGGVGVGVVGRQGAVAFDLLWAPVELDARFVLCNSRASGFESPALSLALGLIDTALGQSVERTGRIVTIARAAERVGRLVLPPLGVRAPRTQALRLSTMTQVGDELGVEMDVVFVPPVLGSAVIRGVELARLTAEADDALVRGDGAAGRAGLMEILERAPRHPEVVRTVVEIDALAEGRVEAPLAMLTETLAEHDYGAVGAELLALAGRYDEARHVLSQATKREVYAPLAARWWVRLAELETSARAGLRCLDEAVALAPSLAEPREARLAARLQVGDVAGALSDAEHLEAAARGTRARHEVCRSAAGQLIERGFVRDAGRLFERALRYAPDDAVATAGLARSFMAVGRPERAAVLLERAIDLGEQKREVPPDALLDLGRLLADTLGDLPGAIARVREVPSASPVGAEARYLEALWRARLGDLAGASVAYGRFREVIELGAELPARQAADYLSEAARFELEVMADAVAAERHLAVAVARRPHDASLAERYRDVAARALHPRRK